MSAALVVEAGPGLPIPGDTEAVFRKSYDSLLEEERRLRAMAEEKARGYVQVLIDVMRLLNPEEMDRRLRSDPFFPANLDPSAWRGLLFELSARRVESARGSAWSVNSGGAPATNSEQAAELDRLRVQVFQLTEALRQVQREGSLPGGTESRTRRSGGEPSRPEQTAATAVPQAAPGGASPAATARPGPSVQVPALPSKAPGKFADLFHKPEDWQKKALVLAILGTTGWSLRLAVADALVQQGVAASGMSGNWKHIYGELESAGLWSQQVIEPGNGLTAHIQVVSLTDTGRRLLRTVGLQPVNSEWEKLMAQHGGEEQAKHAALVVAFAYHARLRGYFTEVCPSVAPPAEPDVLLIRNEERIYVEVEAGSGEPERRMRKWGNQGNLQGFVAVCSTAPEVRKMLAQDARHAAERGMATDLATLISWVNAQDFASFWAETWP